MGNEDFAPPNDASYHFIPNWNKTNSVLDTLPDDRMSPLDALIVEEESLPWDPFCTFGRIMGLEA
jgi:hypothetical protein